MLTLLFLGDSLYPKSLCKIFSLKNCCFQGLWFPLNYSFNNYFWAAQMNGSQISPNPQGSPIETDKVFRRGTKQGVADWLGRGGTGFPEEVAHAQKPSGWVREARGVLVAAMPSGMCGVLSWCIIPTLASPSPMDTPRHLSRLLVHPSVRQCWLPTLCCWWWNSVNVSCSWVKSGFSLCGGAGHCSRWNGQLSAEFCAVPNWTHPRSWNMSLPSIWNSNFPWEQHASEKRTRWDRGRVMKTHI